MMVPPMRWMVGMLPRADHASLAPVALATRRPSSKLAFHSPTASWSKLWWSLPNGMPNSSLSAASSMRLSRFGTEEVQPSVGEPAEVARLERAARDDERAAEDPRVGRLAVAVVGHELRAGGAQVVLHILVEQCPGYRAVVAHHVFSDQAARVGEPPRVPVGRRVKQEARVLRRPGRQHDHARLLHLALLLRVVVLEAANASALGVGQHARDGRARPDFGARLARLGEVGA